MSATERLNRAWSALVATGYFTAEQVGPDIAPRITEMHTAMSLQIAALQSQYCALCHETRPCIHNITPELFCGCGCGNPVGDS